jgi:two-component system, OmpR family, phosphate regulon sensor histidine kinase PhoR
MSDLETKYLLASTMADSAYDALLIVDEERNILATNRSAEKILGGDAEGQKIGEITNVPELAMMVTDALINTEGVFEEQILIGDENYRVRVRLFAHKGGRIIALVLRDITQLVRLNRARRDMVANISHELRTPISNIHLVIEGLFHDRDRPKREASISSLRDIAHETDNLLWLVQGMSDLAMIESGQSIAKLVDTSLHELVHIAIERMINQGKNKEINIVHKVPKKLHVLCDRGLVRRVLVNLIHNAIKWSPEGDVITVSAQQNGDEVTVCVSDNGPGVPEDQVERIFERFYQTDFSRSSGHGTGLGLALCRHIIEAHGGRTWAGGNQDGGGGRFLFTLLVSEEHAPQE